MYIFVYETFKVKFILKQEFFCLPEPNVQVRFSDHLLFVVRMSVNMFVCLLTFYILYFCSRTNGSNLTKLSTEHPYEKGIQLLKYRAYPF